MKQTDRFNKSHSELLDGKSFTKDFNLNYTTIEGNEVTVTAQAKGQMAAINKQLNAKSLVNIISSDRIQELPDANAAETVARVLVYLSKGKVEKGIK